LPDNAAAPIAVPLHRPDDARRAVVTCRHQSVAGGIEMQAGDPAHIGKLEQQLVTTCVPEPRLLVSACGEDQSTIGAERRLRNWTGMTQRPLEAVHAPAPAQRGIGAGIATQLVCLQHEK
jgi:hypothetical protein